ncbi:hypothetical protein Tco_0398028 [Tanacetum coccineum]
MDWLYALFNGSSLIDESGNGLNGRSYLLKICPTEVTILCAKHRNDIAGNYRLPQSLWASRSVSIPDISKCSSLAVKHRPRYELFLLQA